MEHVKFERGKDPIETMNIGVKRFIHKGDSALVKINNEFKTVIAIQTEMSGGFRLKDSVISRIFRFCYDKNILTARLWGDETEWISEGIFCPLTEWYDWTENI
jgi:hypothetical protein